MWWTNNSEHRFLIEYERQSFRYANKEKILGMSLNALKQALLLGMKMLEKAQPNYKEPIDAMRQYLSGKGKDVQMPDEWFPPHLKQAIIHKIMRKIGKYYWRPGEHIQKVFGYSDYPSLAASRDDADYFAKGEISNFLQYVIGGFVADVWYEVEDNGTVHVYCKIDDKYDWQSREDATSYNLETLGLDSPVIVRAIQKACNFAGPKLCEFDADAKILTVYDRFWQLLEEKGLAKSYAHYYEGELFSLKPNELRGHVDPLDMIEAYANLGLYTVRNIKELQYLIEHDLITQYQINESFGPFAAEPTTTPEMIQLISSHFNIPENTIVMALKQAMMYQPLNEFIKVYQIFPVSLKSLMGSGSIPMNSQKAQYIIETFYQEWINDPELKEKIREIAQRTNNMELYDKIITEFSNKPEIVQEEPEEFLEENERLAQTSPIDLQIQQLQNSIAIIKQQRGDRAEINKVLQEILRLKKLKRTGAYMPIR